MNVPRPNAPQSLRPAVSGIIGEAAADRFSLADISPTMAITPQACSCEGQKPCTCGKGSPQSYIYAIGGIRAVFPSLSVEKEFYQAVDQIDSIKPPSKTLIFDTLSRAENLYIAREMCWVLQGVVAGSTDYFIVKPRSYNELTGLIESIAPRPPDEIDFDLVVGLRGPLASPEMCNGLRLPIVVCTEAFDFTNQEIIKAITSSIAGGTTDKATDIFWSIIKLTNNTGDTDEYRAINFLATRYLGLYRTTYLLKYPTLINQESFSLLRVVAQPASVQGTRKILDVILTYHGATSNVALQWYCSVDVTSLFPSLVTPMTRYYGYYQA